VWLQAFQSNLSSVQSGGSSNQSYTTEELITGIETLVNIASGKSIENGYLISKMDTISLDMSSISTQLRSIYVGSYDAYKLFYDQQEATTTFPHNLDLEVLVGSPTKIVVKSTLSKMDACVIDELTPSQSSSSDCASPFSSPTAYRAGWGDKEGVLLFWNELFCEEPCGETGICQAGPTTAFEGIQAALNKNFYAVYPAPTPPTGKKLIGYANIDCKNVDIRFGIEGCWSGTFPKAGTCVNADLLNCFYCSIMEGVNPASPFMTNIIPNGKSFVSINLSTDVLNAPYPPCGDPINRKLLLGEICYGDPIYGFGIINYWSDPVLVDLTQMFTE
jgi:hypothetical protein